MTMIDEETFMTDEEAFMTASHRRLDNEYYSTENFQSIFATLLMSGLGAIALIATFESLHSRPSLFAVFHPRVQEVPPHRQPPAPCVGFCAWAALASSMPERELRRHIGLDAFMMMRYIKVRHHATQTHTNKTRRHLTQHTRTHRTPPRADWPDWSCEDAHGRIVGLTDTSRETPRRSDVGAPPQ